MTIILFTLMITFLASTYMIGYSHKLFLIFEKVLKIFGVKDITVKEKPEAEAEKASYAVIFLGFYKVASSLLRALEKQDAAMIAQIMVLDFNPDVCRELNKRGIKCMFGDLGNTGILNEVGIDKARLVISTIPDTILKGTDNMSLLSYIKRVNPSSKVIVTAERVMAAENLWNAGADFVILPQVEMSEKLVEIMQKLLTEDKTPDICEDCHKRLTNYKGAVID